MNMYWLDWVIVGAVIAVTVLIGKYTQRFVKGVADYLSAGRCAGRYLMMTAQEMSGFSAAALIANYEQYHKSGFTGIWWYHLMLPTTLFISLSGFIRYRFRETRALTMAQFFEMRYSRSFRVFAGILCWFSGIINYGIFPGVTARLLISFCGLPESFTFAGMVCPMFPVVMLIMLSLALYLTLAGGQIALMVTDFFQGQFALVVMVVMAVFLLTHFNWDVIMEAVQSAPENQSLINPYKQSELRDFSVYFFLMMGFNRIYGFMAWQGSQGYFSSAENPHEAKMAGILGAWRSTLNPLLMAIPPVIAFTVLHHGLYAKEASAVQQVMSSIADPQTQKQILTPVTIVQFLPVGMVGLFTALAIALAVSTDDTYLHSWGSIFIQDVVLPFKKKKLTPEQHIRWLRWAAVGTAVIVFFFSLFFPLRQYIFMYMQLTGAIFIGGAGSVIIGGLYWSRGTAAGAWTSMITGFLCAIIGLIILTWWQNIPFLAAWRPGCPVNGMQVAFFTALICMTLYITVSLLTCKKPFDMNWLLHRGKYAAAGEHVPIVEKQSFRWRLLGVDKEYSLKDKIVASGVAGYTIFWSILLIVATLINKWYKFSDKFWADAWHVIILSLTGLTIITLIWFIWGGLRDMAKLFKKLKVSNRDAADDGSVNQAN
ncbi:MAG: hypothetical protein WC959_05085 [Kiritimatiellales bacterium]